MSPREYTITKSKLGAVITYGNPHHRNFDLLDVVDYNLSAALVFVNGAYPMVDVPEDAFGVRYIAHESYPPSLRSCLSAAINSGVRDIVAFVPPTTSLTHDLTHLYAHAKSLGRERAFGFFVKKDGKLIAFFVSHDLLPLITKHIPVDASVEDGLAVLDEWATTRLRFPKYGDVSNLSVADLVADPVAVPAPVEPSLYEGVVSVLDEAPEPATATETAPAAISVQESVSVTIEAGTLDEDQPEAVSEPTPVKRKRGRPKKVR